MLGIVAAVAALALILTVVLNFNFLYGSMIRIFGSDADYFKYVEVHSFKQYSDTASNFYDSWLLKNATQDQSVQTTLNWHIGDSAFDLIDTLGNTGDLSWLNEIELEVDANTAKDLNAMEVGLNISNQDILTLSVIVDYLSEQMFLSVPELSDDVLTTDISEVFGTGTSAGLSESFQLTSQLEDILPSKSTFYKLLVKYVDIALDDIDNVSSKKHTLDIDGMSQKCTALESRITEKDLANMLKSVLRAMKKDEEIQSIIASLQDGLADAELLYDDEIDLYEEFIDQIDLMLDDAEELRNRASTDPLLTVTSYVNGSHEVIGRKLVANEETVLSYATVQNGKQFASEVQLDSGSVMITGSGTQDHDKTDGDYMLCIDGIDYLSFEVEDFDTETLQQGYPNGTFRFSPQKQLLSELGLDRSSLTMLSVLDPVLELKYETSEEAASLEADILNQDELFVGFTVKSDMSNGKSIKAPTENLVSVNDEVALERFVRSLDFNKVLRKLEETDLPSDIIRMIQFTIDDLEQSMR